MKYIYELINIGKGIYGLGNSQITPQNLLLIHEEECWNTPPDEECCIDIYDSGSLMSRRGALDFIRMDVFDDELADKTIIRSKTITTVSDFPPTGSIILEGDEWINNTNWKRYKRYDDYWVEVKYGSNYIEYVNTGSVENFTELLDTPSTYSTHANKVVVVRNDELGLQFVNIADIASTSSAGLGLSIDGNGDIQLGDNTTLFYTDTPELKDFFLAQTKTGLGSFLYSGYGATQADLAEAGFGTVSGINGIGTEIATKYNSTTETGFIELKLYAPGAISTLTMDQTTGFIIRNDINQFGMKYFANYFDSGSLDPRWVPDWGAIIATFVDFVSDQTITGQKKFTKPILVDNVELSNQFNSDVDSLLPEVVAEVSSSLYTAVFFDYSIKKGTNLRAGTVISTHDGTDVTFTETMTQDLGNTAGVDLTVELNSGSLQLIATTDSDDWIIKTLVRAI